MIYVLIIIGSFAGAWGNGAGATFQEFTSKERCLASIEAMHEVTGNSYYHAVCLPK